MIAKKHRINREFIPYILKKGESKKSGLFIIRFTKNQEKSSRFRVIVSKKIHPKAVKRNYLRRQIYEAIRESSKEITDNKKLDIIFIPKKTILKNNYQEIKKDIKEILQKVIK